MLQRNLLEAQSTAIDSFLVTVLSMDDTVAVVQDFNDNPCTPEHCYHAFDALFCALTNAAPLNPKFPDDK